MCRAAAAAMLAIASVLLPRIVGQPACTSADFNGSGTVTVGDLLLCLGSFGRDAVDPVARPFDLDSSGQIDVGDLLLTLSAFGRTCSDSVSGASIDACGCAVEQGWSSGAAACTDDGHTSGSEAAACSPALPRQPPAAEESCNRLAEEGLDCAACIPPESLPIDDGLSCSPRAAADAMQAEHAALWSDRTPSALYNRTAFLWAENVVRTIELDMPEANWRFLITDPIAEEYTEATVRLVFAAGEGRQPAEFARVGVRFKGYYGSLRLCNSHHSSIAGPNIHNGVGVNLSGSWGVCNKLSLKIKFNYRDREQRFYVRRSAI